jgi:hypothetical protein
MINSGWDGARSSADISATCICAAHSQILSCITPNGTQFLRSDGHGLGPTACGKLAASFLWHRCSTVCLTASLFPVGEADRTAVASDPTSAPFLDFPMPPSPDASYQNFLVRNQKSSLRLSKPEPRPGGCALRRRCGPDTGLSNTLRASWLHGFNRQGPTTPSRNRALCLAEKNVNAGDWVA